MADIETIEESHALAAAAELIADSYHDNTRGGAWTPEIRSAVRQAWIAGRDWAREHDEAERVAAAEMDADIADRLERAGALGRHLHGYYDRMD